MAKRRREPPKAVREIIETVFKGNKIVDPEAYAEARKGLSPEDQQFLDDLRDTAFGISHIDEDDLADDEDLDLGPRS